MAGRTIRISPFAPALGAEVRGIDLADGLDASSFEQVHAAFLRYGVLFFREQSEIPPSVQVAIGRLFGDLHVHPAAPQMPGYPEVFVIHAHRDSKVANGEFWHSDVSCDEVPPLGTMLQINELTEEESRAVLDLLFDHGEQVDFQIRFRWARNDVAFWDNRCVMHRAIWDYWPHERKGRRVTVAGDRPR